MSDGELTVTVVKEVVNSGDGKMAKSTLTIARSVQRTRRADKEEDGGAHGYLEAAMMWWQGR